MHPWNVVRCCALAGALLLAIGIPSCASSERSGASSRDGDMSFNMPVPLDSARFVEVLSIPGTYLNDHTLIRVAGLWHLFFTEGAISNLPWNRSGNETRIGHASSVDLRRWEIHEAALTVGARGTVDGAHIYAPHVIANKGVYYMFYAGQEFIEGPEHLCVATSTDLITWTKDPGNPFFRPDSSWAMYSAPSKQFRIGGPTSGRDPFVAKDDDYGFVLYYVARLRVDSVNGYREGELSCVAAATSRDLRSWKDQGPVLVRRTIGVEQANWMHLESPVVIKHNHYNYLFYKSGSGTRLSISPNALDFQFVESYPFSSAHAAEIVDDGERFDQRWYITSCSRAINDIHHEYSDRTKGLFLANLEWDGRWPRIARLSGDTTPAR